MGSEQKSTFLIFFHIDIPSYLLKKYFGIKAVGPYINKGAGSIHVKRNGERIRTNQDNYYIELSRKRDVQRFLSEVGFSIIEKQIGSKRR